MSKRKKVLSGADLQKIANELVFENENSASDFDSDDSVTDPVWKIDPKKNPVSQQDSEESSDEEFNDNNDIENVLRGMVLEEVAKEEEENDTMTDEEVLSLNSGWTEYIKANEIGKICVKDPSFTGVLNCGVETLLKVLDQAVVTKNIEVFPGLSIVRDSSTYLRTSKEFREQLPSNSSERYENLFNLLLRATKRFIEGRSLQIKLSNRTVESVARVLEEGK
ncbi:unnamed protein product [Psylliodes chrysocephalus]|uniref:Uncharacterized protein n=1 Tax=Psylliodes chrysocephalus TaxID=3402493 RepID=A0A9P0GCY9_9CUCU|nr:unnamed protein product [Psylliodes chrysocephala]